MRRVINGWHMSAAVFVALVVATIAISAEPVLAQLDQHVYMPLVAVRADLSELEPPVAQTATPTSTETVDVPPSQTPVPGETPKPEGGGKVVGRMLLKGEPLPEQLGAEYPGPGIFLRVCRGSEVDCDVVDRVGVDGDSRYELTYSAALAAGEFAQVIWWNEFGMYGDHEVSGDPLYLGAWYGPRITDLSPDLATSMDDIELANIELTEPPKGFALGGFGHEFKWGSWANVPKAYRWSIGHCCQNLHQRPGVYQKSVGKSTSYIMDSQPPGTRIDPDERYCWFIQVDAENGKGYGHSFEARMLWFIPTAPDGDVRPAGWTSH